MKFLVFIACCVCLLGCKKKEKQTFFDTKVYYYPYQKLSTAQVYEYKIEHEGALYVSHYWKYQSMEEDGNTYLLCQRYNPSFEMDQSIKELIIEDGVITSAYYFHVKDSLSQQMRAYPNHVTQNVVFPFKASLDTVMAYRFICEMKLPPDFLTAKLIRDRKFSEASTYVFQGDTLEAVVFTNTDLYDIQNVEEGGYWTVKKGVVEIYAKGLGLVYQEERTAGEAASEICKLTAIYSEESFEKLQESAQLKD